MTYDNVAVSSDLEQGDTARRIFVGRSVAKRQQADKDHEKLTTSPKDRHRQMTRVRKYHIFENIENIIFLDVFNIFDIFNIYLCIYMQ